MLKHFSDMPDCWCDDNSYNNMVGRYKIPRPKGEERCKAAFVFHIDGKSENNNNIEGKG